MLNHRSRQIALAMLLALTLPACTPPSAANKTNSTIPQATSTIVGKAFLNEPVSGATLKIFDLSGKLLSEIPNATDANGFFNLSLPASTPRDFRAEVSGGSCGSTPSTAIHKADVRNFDPVADRLFINAATTLVAARLDQNPQASLKEIQASVARFLRLPADTALGADLDSASFKLFSHATFMNLANGQGGLNPFVTSLAGQITGDATVTYDFSNQLINGVAADIAKTVAIELGKGAVGKIGSTLMGTALDAIYGSSPMSSEELSKQYADLKEATVKGFRDLDGRMFTLQTDVDAIKKSIAALEVSMNKQFGLAAYNTKIDALLTSIAMIDTLYDSYLYELDRFDTSPAGKARVASLVEQIQSGVPTALTAIHYAMVGTGGGDGAIPQWHRVVGNNNRNGENGGNRYPYLVNANFVNQLNDQFDYFEGLQLRGGALLVEARNFKQDAAGAKRDYDRIMANLTTQREAVYSPRISGMLISPLTGLMWSGAPLANGGSVLFSVGVNFTLESLDLKLTALRTGDHTDWRMPTFHELYMIGAGDSHRSVSSLRQAGFNLPSEVNTCDGILIPQTLWENYWCLNTEGKLSLANPSGIPKLFVLPVRSFKADPLATL